MLIDRLVAALALLEASWMAFDGIRALIVGSYVTSTTGAYAGQLGPWSYVVAAVGIPPDSTAMKAIFAGYGLAWLFVTGFFLGHRARARTAMLAAAAGSLWYLPIGTLFSALQLALLLFVRRR